MAKRKTKRRTRKRDPLAGLEPHVANLYRAVGGYVEALGGSVVVIGGIQVQEWPGETAGKFRLAVLCMGRKPQYRESP